MSTNRCKLTECLGRARCKTCLAMDAAYPAPCEAIQPAGWRDIATAPKDGTDILLSNGATVAEGHWLHAEPYIRERRDLDGRYIDQDESDGHDGWVDWSGGMRPEPTHWMPIPAPSATAAPEEPKPNTLGVSPDGAGLSGRKLPSIPDAHCGGLSDSSHKEN